MDYYFWSGAVAFDVGDWSRAEDAYETVSEVGQRRSLRQ